jgi:hypothetical protein
METYHKINALFKRHTEGKKKGKLIVGNWSQPEFEYLADNQWEFTEKVDGTNVRIGWGFPAGGRYKEVSFGGRTDRATLPNGIYERLPEIFNVSSMDDVFADVGAVPVVLFGEGYGPKIQKIGHQYLDHQDFVLFDVKVGDWWLNRKDVDDIAANLGIKSVPVIGQGTLQDAIDIVSSGITFNKTGAVVRWGRGGLQSQWGNFEAEGIVARPVVPLCDRGGGRIITKIKGVDFK